MPYPKLHPEGRKLTKIGVQEYNLLKEVSNITGTPVTMYLREACEDWYDKKGKKYVEENRLTTYYPISL